MNETGSSQHISAEAVPLLSCPLCGSSNLVEGVAYPHASSAKEPAMMCCDCTCRALKSDWQKRPAAPAMPATDAVREALEVARQAIEYSIDMGGTDPAGVLLRALNKADAALSHPSQGGWQPIETAPKNSQSRLVWVPSNRCTYCVSWVQDGEKAGWNVFGGGWRDQIQGATHWMPLPDAPAPPEVQP